MIKMARNEQMLKVFILSIVLIAIFGFLDSIQIVPWQLSQIWEPYNTYVMPAIISMWVLALLGISVMYYLLKKDKSEAVGIFVASFIMLAGGLEDIFFFLLSSNQMTAAMCWFTGPQAIVSRFLGETCVTPISLYINVGLSIILAWVTLKWFFRQRW